MSEDEVFVGGVYPYEGSDDKEVEDRPRVFTRTDMYRAFWHGIEFKSKPKNQTGDVPITKLPDEELPFSEWLARHYGDRKYR